ncbi:hypothetical protein BT63DRAFT_421170 [Microthyrium microscopicum]|uniref:CCHC-type domain-containing protein n=1 Tax=Microthyrium microscopicum TaxID=703497 RepID=A0A6A6UL31_9PEZI|nr:hypothetical protein BT63DRAFT_421170 [Microthyrium microscopicum]
MSSRLLTMKFMQRAAASSTDSPPSKRQRMSNGSSAPRHSTSDLKTMNDALAEEETKREQALERQAAEKGETKWVLSIQQADATPATALSIATAGFADIDASSDEDAADKPDSRMRFGKPLTTDSADKPRPSENSDEEDSEDDEEDYDPSSVDQLLAQGQAAAAKTTPSRPIDDGITFGSISAGGGTKAPVRKCFICNQPGHMRNDCPRAPRNGKNMPRGNRGGHSGSNRMRYPG